MRWTYLGWPADDLHFSRLEGLFQIALDLQGSLSGLTLDDIVSCYGVSRRTSTRMLSSVRRAIGESHFESATDAEGRRRWRLVRPKVNGLFRFGADELASLDNLSNSPIARERPFWRVRWTRFRASSEPSRPPTGSSTSIPI
jgi:hypothetical protein